MGETEVPRGVLQQQHRLPAQPDLEVEGDAAPGSSPRRRQRAGRPDQRSGAHRKLPAGAAAGAEGSGSEGGSRAPRRKVCGRPGGAWRVPPRSFREVPPSASWVKMARGTRGRGQRTGEDADRKRRRERRAGRRGNPAQRRRGGAAAPAVGAVRGAGAGRAAPSTGTGPPPGWDGPSRGRAAPLRHQTAAATQQAIGAD